jgi:hypothetical protein
MIVCFFLHVLVALQLPSQPACMVQKAILSSNAAGAVHPLQQQPFSSGARREDS